VAHVTPMATLAKQMKSNRIVTGTKIPHPCGDPNLSMEADHALRREIVTTALRALQTVLKFLCPISRIRPDKERI